MRVRPRDRVHEGEEGAQRTGWLLLLLLWLLLLFFDHEEGLKFGQVGCYCYCFGCCCCCFAIKSAWNWADYIDAKDGLSSSFSTTICNEKVKQNQCMAVALLKIY